MNMKPYDGLPWWCQLLWPWFGPPWYEQVEDLEAFLSAHWCALHLSADELAELLAGDDPPGEGYLAKAARLSAARHQAQEIISHECGAPAPEDEGDGDEDDEPTPAEERPVVVDRSHPTWAEGGRRAARAYPRFCDRLIPGSRQSKPTPHRTYLVGGRRHITYARASLS